MTHTKHWYQYEIVAAPIGIIVGIVAVYVLTFLGVM